MPAIARLLALLFLLLCQACTSLERQNGGVPVSTHAFRFADGGMARYYVLDKRAPADVPAFPATYLFVIPGSDCVSMGGVLPGYFDGLEGRAGAVRVFILQKRLIAAGQAGHCSDEFIRADHPQRWLADQEEFIRAELAAAADNGQAPTRVVIAGLSEGAEIAPLLARRIPRITHVALLANGGMDPFDTYRLQLHRHGLQHALADIERLCTVPSDEVIAAERTCRYWKELQAIRHTDNLLALDLPVFIAMGEADTMVPIEAAWHIRDRFAERGKDKLQLLVLPGTGHDLKREGKSVLPTIWEAFDQWLQK